MFKQIRESLAVPFAGGDLVIAGPVLHDDDQRALVLDDPSEGGYEVLTTNLAAYGLTAPAGHVWIKDWSEHEGLAASLAALGLVEEVGEAFVGLFSSRAVLARVLVEGPSTSA